LGGQRRRCGSVLCPTLTAALGLSLTTAAAGAAGPSSGGSACLAAATASWGGLRARAPPPLGGGREVGGPRRLGGGGSEGSQRRRGGIVLSPDRHGRGQSLAAAAGEASWEGLGVAPLGLGGGPVWRLRRRGGAVLCPPLRAYHPPLSLDNNLEVWCRNPANEREYLLEEWDDPFMEPHEVTRGSKKVNTRWKCRKEGCGHVWFALVGNRTSRGDRCPACAGNVPTATNNLEVHCEEKGLELLLREWALTDRRPKDFLPQSHTKVPWKCEECGWGWNGVIYSRTGSNPCGCPGCAGKVATPTNNLQVHCEENGREDLLGAPRHGDEGLHAAVKREGAVEVRMWVWVGGQNPGPHHQAPRVPGVHEY